MGAKMIVYARYSKLKIVTSTAPFIILIPIFLYIALLSFNGNYNGRYDSTFVIIASLLAIPACAFVSYVGSIYFLRATTKVEAIYLDGDYFFARGLKVHKFPVKALKIAKFGKNDPGRIFFILDNGSTLSARISLMKEGRVEILSKINQSIVDSNSQ